MRVKRKGGLEYFIGRRYGDFNRLHKKLRTELPGKILPSMPRKNKQNSTTQNIISGMRGKGVDDDASSMSSVSTMGTMGTESSMKNLTVKDKRSSVLSFGRSSPRPSMDERPPTPGTPAEPEVKPSRKQREEIS